MKYGNPRKHFLDMIFDFGCAGCTGMNSAWTNAEEIAKALEMLGAKSGAIIGVEHHAGGRFPINRYMLVDNTTGIYDLPVNGWVVLPLPLNADSEMIPITVLVNCGSNVGKELASGNYAPAARLT
jgi:hypothetical protein